MNRITKGEANFLPYRVGIWRDKKTTNNFTQDNLSEKRNMIPFSCSGIFTIMA